MIDNPSIVKSIYWIVRYSGSTDWLEKLYFSDISVRFRSNNTAQTYKKR